MFNYVPVVEYIMVDTLIVPLIPSNIDQYTEARENPRTQLPHACEPPACRSYLISHVHSLTTLDQYCFRRLCMRIEFMGDEEKRERAYA